jgi:cell shape-determining protein MreD
MPMGLQMISFGLFGTLLAYLNRVMAIKRMPYQALAIFAASILTGILTHLLAYITGEPVVANVYAVIFITALYSSIVGPFLFLPTAWWMRIKTNRFGRRH